MNVTEVPAQIVEADAAICTESVPTALTTIVIALDVEVAGDTQVPVGVMIHVTTLPLASVVVV